MSGVVDVISHTGLGPVKLPQTNSFKATGGLNCGSAGAGFNPLSSTTHSSTSYHEDTEVPLHAVFLTLTTA